MAYTYRERGDDEFYVGGQKVWEQWKDMPPINTWCKKHECSRTICITLEATDCQTPEGKPFDESDYDACLV